MIQFIPALVSFGAKAASVAATVSSVRSAAGGLGASSAGNARDRERYQRAQQLLEQARGGSLAAAQEILQQRFNSATTYGKGVYAEAWRSLESERPQLAAEALNTRREVVSQGRPGLSTQLGDELERLWANLRRQTADTAQRVIAGAGTSAAEEIAGDEPGSRITVPTSKSELAWIAAAIVVALLLAWWFSRKR